MLITLIERLNTDRGEKATLLRDAVKSGFDQIEQGESVLYTTMLVEKLQREAHKRASDGKAPKSDVTP